MNLITFHFLRRFILSLDSKERNKEEDIFKINFYIIYLKVYYQNLKEVRFNVRRLKSFREIRPIIYKKSFFLTKIIRFSSLFRNIFVNE